MPFITADDVTRKSFDYVVIGGGTAGLTAAVRLSEDPSVSVLVLEAGAFKNFDIPVIDIRPLFEKLLGNPEYDWGFQTVKQGHANDIELPWGRGKILGGTSAINALVWSKPPAEDIDAIESLGNPGWNWADYHKYSKKSETVHLPAKEQTDLYPHTFTGEHGGKSGPIQVAIAPHLHTIDKLFQKTMTNMGLKTIDDPYGGNITGTWIAAANLDPKTWARSYAAKAYLRPNIGRPNLNIISSALVSRIVLQEVNGEGRFTATAVEFIHGNTTLSAKASKEVILCAGTIKSPQILELSGIGRPEVLTRIGVDVKIDLPGVGENVQEHMFVSLPCELAPNQGHETLDLLSDPEYAAKARDLIAIGKGLYRVGFSSVAFFPLSTIDSEDSTLLVDNLEAEIDAASKGGELAPGLEGQFRLQIAALRNDAIPDCELLIYPGMFSRKVVAEPGKLYVSPMAILNHPISRGTIHAENKDPAVSPAIDPHYLENKFDLEALLRIVKFIRKMEDTEPWKSGILREVFPGPDCKSDEDLKEFIKDSISTTWHTAGSCSMLPRDKQGVVDPQLKVYGTTNLRVADISIIPLHIAAHTQATAYVIGEKVADLIKENSIKD